MLKITVSSQDGRATVKLEGKLLEPWLHDLQEACSRIREAGVQLQLDLRDLSFVDLPGEQTLLAILRDGASIGACSGFVAQLLQGGETHMTAATTTNSHDGITTMENAPEALQAEIDLLARVRAGDEAACETLVRTYGPRMLAVARRFLSCEDDCDDAVQDAFISAFKAIDRFAGEARLGTWLHRVVVNACLMKLRRQRKSETSIEALLPAFAGDGHHAHRVAAWDDEGFARLSASETRARVRACIDQLPERYRTVLLLRDIQELDTREAAELLDCSVANVKTRLHRARQALRTLLQSAEQFE